MPNRPVFLGGAGPSFLWEGWAQDNTRQDKNGRKAKVLEDFKIGPRARIDSEGGFLAAVRQGDEDENGSQRDDGLEWICHCALFPKGLLSGVSFSFCSFIPWFYYLRTDHHAA